MGERQRPTPRGPDFKNRNMWRYVLVFYFAFAIVNRNQFCTTTHSARMKYSVNGNRWLHTVFVLNDPVPWIPGEVKGLSTREYNINIVPKEVMHIYYTREHLEYKNCWNDWVLLNDMVYSALKGQSTRQYQMYQPLKKWRSTSRVPS